MSSRITVTLKIIVKDEGVTFLVGAERREMNVPDGFTRIESGKKISFYPEGGTHRLGKAETAYLSIYIELPGGVWKCCCQNHPFKENRSFTVTADNTFFENPY